MIALSPCLRATEQTMPVLIKTDYALKLFFPNSTFAQVYYEAIANALDANATEITIYISTTQEITQKHLEITVHDNGEGFTETRFERFRESQESDPFHKGLGRLVYLRYFSQVDVESVYEGKKRTFGYSKQFDGLSNVTDADPKDKPGTTLKFSGFLRDRIRAYEDVSPSALKARIREQFLPYLHKRKRDHVGFIITIELDVAGSGANETLYPDKQQITPDDIPEFITAIIQDDQLRSDITMRYILEKDSAHRTLLTAVSIDGRTIPLTLLESRALPPASSAIFLFESDLFGTADTGRQGLTLPERVNPKELDRVLRREVSAILNENFEEIERQNTRTRKDFENRYPHLTGYFEETTVGIIDREEALWSAEKRFFHDQKQVLESHSLDDATFEKSLEVSSRTLTEYILYRERIIQRLKSFTGKDRETAIHNLIVPRYKTYHQEGFIDWMYRNNAWLLDDKFMSYRAMLSEGTMRKLISEITLGETVVEDDGRPDIAIVFSADPDGPEKVDVVVIEIKKKDDDVKENTFAGVQLITRAQILADHCPNIQRVWYFGIIEINDDLAKFLSNANWTPLFSKGRVFYQEFSAQSPDGEKIPAPTCLLSYDALIEDASARNHTFLEILKSEIKKAQAHNNGHDQLRLDQSGKPF
jgi:hypothetical protein